MVKLSLPSSMCFTSGELIPFNLTIVFVDAPDLVRLLLQHVQFKLLKRTRIWTNGGRDINVRHLHLGSGKPLWLYDSTKGVNVLNGVIQAGAAGRECSWRVHGVAEVQVSPCIS